MKKRTRPVALLDVNVLVALFDPDHVHHDAAHDWFADQRKHGWATCPLTENGFIRTVAALSRAREPIAASELAERLRRFTESEFHRFWADELSLRDDGVFALEHVGGHQQLTDVYLLALVVKRGGVLATFDRKIPVRAVLGATPSHLAALAPDP